MKETGFFICSYAHVAILIDMHNLSIVGYKTNATKWAQYSYLQQNAYAISIKWFACASESWYQIN